MDLDGRRACGRPARWRARQRHRSGHLRFRSTRILAIARKTGKLLVERGWKIQRIKEDGGCFEVYAFDEKGDRVEAYFHPKTLDLVPTSRYPRKT
ncbi:MAG: PepSY domain-containing protein [Betaproteobacteria bacterium]|nr:PepSY domain-containing protein [Betaproteobacteria bacterium]